MHIAILVYKNDNAHWDEDSLRVIDSELLGNDLRPYNRENAPEEEAERRSELDAYREELNELNLKNDFSWDDAPDGLNVLIYRHAIVTSHHFLDPVDYDVEREGLQSFALGTWTREWWVAPAEPVAIGPVVQALQWYADPANYNDDGTPGVFGYDPETGEGDFDPDEGYRARRALCLPEPIRQPFPLPVPPTEVTP